MRNRRSRSSGAVAKEPKLRHRRARGFGEVYADRSELSSEAQPRILPSRGLRVYVTLLLDVSQSVQSLIDVPGAAGAGGAGARQGPLIEAAQNFVDELLVGRGLEEVYIGIQVFDGSPDIQHYQLPIGDPDRIKEQLASLVDYDPPDISSTNLNGAALSAVDWLQQRQQQVIQANDGGVQTVGYLVIFTDGADTAGRVDEDVAAEALSTARTIQAATPGPLDTIVTTYGVALNGADYVAGSLDDLLSGPIAADVGTGTICENTCIFAGDGECDDGGPGARYSVCSLGTDCDDCGTRTGGTSQGNVDGSRYVFNADEDTLNDQFQELALAISRRLTGTYLLAYCSPKRSGQHRLSINVDPEARPETLESRGFDFPFDATGFAGGCTGEMFDNLCGDDSVNRCGGFNCGACDDETEVCNAATDTCENACLAQNFCAGETITNTFGYEQVCVFPDLTDCGAQCADLQTDASNCGACGNACATGASCEEGVCVCDVAGETDCGTGCYDLQTDEDNCGACGNFCPASATCVDGVCDCGNGQIGCSGVCYDLSITTNHCGACGNACLSGATCVDSACTCSLGTDTLCDNGCYDLQTDSAHCGACENACNAYTETCSTGACACSSTSYTDCGSGCVYTLYNPFHCGACDSPCTRDEGCSGGTCVAGMGTSSCADEQLAESAQTTYSGTTDGNVVPGDYCYSTTNGYSLSWRAPEPGVYSVSITGTNVQLSILQGCTSLYDCREGEGSTTLSISSTSQRDYVFYVTTSSGTPEPFTLTVELQ